MKLRTKTLLSLAALAVFSIVGLFAVLRQTMIKNILVLEHEDHERNVQRVVSAIQEDNRQYELKAADYSTWDDTYDFMVTLSPKYIDSNLGDTMYGTLDIDMILFLDTNDKVRYFDARSELKIKEVPHEMAKFIAERKELFRWKNGEESHVGFIRFGDQILQVVMRGITNSKMDKAPRGTLFYIKYFNKARTDRLGQVTNFSVNARLLPPGAKVPQDPVIRAVSEDLVEGVVVMNDLFGEPLFEVKVGAPRFVYQQGKRNLWITLELVAVLCIAILFSVLLLINRLAMSRLKIVNQLISSTKRDNAAETMPQLKTMGEDEIGMLSSKIHDLYNQVRNLADFDELTGVHNIRYFKTAFEEYFKLAQRHERQLGLILFDADFFKKVNDTYGHLQGDMVLKWLGAMLKEHTRTTDVSARYGGEEFILLLSETDEFGVKIVAEKLRAAVESLEIPSVEKNGKPIKVTISLGLSTFSPAVKTPEMLLAIVDKALYEAKKAGRNRSVYKHSQSEV